MEGQSKIMCGLGMGNGQRRGPISGTTTKGNKTRRVAAGRRGRDVAHGHEQRRSYYDVRQGLAAVWWRQDQCRPTQLCSPFIPTPLINSPAGASSSKLRSLQESAHRSPPRLAGRTRPEGYRRDALQKHTRTHSQNPPDSH